MTQPQSSSVESETSVGVEQHARLTLRVNDAIIDRTISVRTSLADFLRDELGLTGTHLGCEHGVCGACTVLVDGRSVRSCLTLALQVQSSAVTTIEGAARSAVGQRVQQALSDRRGLQCGFCTPGFVMSLVELVQEKQQRRHAAGRELDETAIRERLSGNICRCTGYQGIVDAALEVCRPIEQRSAMTTPGPADQL